MALLVFMWLFPTVGLFVSSFRTADQIATTGWWKAPFAAEQNLQLRTGGPDAQLQEGDLFVIEGNLFDEDGRDRAEISVFGVSSRAIDAFNPGDEAELRRGGTITVQANGDYRMVSAEEFSGSRGQRGTISTAIVTIA